MIRAVDPSKDGAEPFPWRDYAAHLALVAAAVGLVTLRAIGVVDWSWWAVLTPIWLLLVVFIASFIAAVTHSTDVR